jgi:hypothetical protein
VFATLAAARAQYPDRPSLFQRYFEVTNYRATEAKATANEIMEEDSSFYLGPMLMGLYEFARANNQEDLEDSLPWFKRALAQLEADPSIGLLERKLDAGAWSGDRYYLTYQGHYISLCQNIKTIYEALDQAGAIDSMFAYVARYRSKNFEFDFSHHLDLAWAYYKHRKLLRSAIDPRETFAYALMQDSLHLNLSKAFAHVDSVETFLESGVPELYNTIGYEPANVQNRVEYTRTALNNYRGMLHAYQAGTENGGEFDYKEAVDYFGRLPDYSAVTRDVNTGYAHFGALRFAEAKKSFERARSATEGDDYGRESIQWNLALSNYDVMSHNLEEGVQRVQDDLRYAPYREGWGWNHLARARLEYYSGRTETGDTCLAKAQRFNENNLFSSFTGDQYDFLKNTYAIILSDANRRRAAFEDTHWWAQTKHFLQAPLHHLVRQLGMMRLVRELDKNPERFDVYYRFFNSEATINFDEVWPAIRHFSPAFFERLYSEGADKNRDNQPGRGMYYDYMQAKIQLQEGQTLQAMNNLIAIFDNDAYREKLEEESSRLLRARLHESLALAAQKSGPSYAGKLKEHRNKFFREYPEIFPYSELKMVFALEEDFSEHQPDNLDEIRARLRRTNLTLMDEKSGDIALLPQVRLSAYQKEAPSAKSAKSDSAASAPRTVSVIKIAVTFPEEEALAEEASALFESELVLSGDAERDGVDLAYALFGIRKAKPEQD